MVTKQIGQLTLALALGFVGVCSAHAEVLTLDAFLKFNNIVECQISPDGRNVVSVVASPNERTDEFQFSLVLSSVSSGEKRVLTQEQTDFAPRWNSDSRRLAFLRADGGQDHLCLIDTLDADFPTTELVSPGLPIENFNWSNGGDTIAFLAPAGGLQGKVCEPRTQDNPNQIYLLNVVQNEWHQLTAIDSHITGFCWSPNGKQIVFSSQRTSSKDDGFRQNIALVSVADGVVTQLVDRVGNDQMPEWSPDGRFIAYQSTCGSTKSHGENFLCIITPDGKPTEFPSATNGVFAIDDVRRMEWAGDSKSLYFEKSVGVESHLFELVLDSGQVERVSTTTGVFSNFTFTRDRNTMAFLSSAANRGKQVVVSPLSGFSCESILDENQWLQSIELGAVERISWKSTDCVEIEGIITYPVGYTQGRRYPVVTYLHGGPSDTFQLGFGPYCLSAEQTETFPTQVLAGLGYVVFAPNPRGSGGYGIEFRELADKDWGRGPADDVLTGVEMLIDLGIADPDRLAIGGHCYGGYLTEWILCHSDRFKTGIANAGISNLVSHFGLGDIPTTSIDYFGGTPWEASGVYHDLSPLTHVQKLTTPILLHHGEFDERVPINQSLELLRALRHCGTSSELLIYAKQGHVLRNLSDLRVYHTANLAWIERWLDPAAESTNPTIR